MLISGQRRLHLLVGVPTVVCTIGLISFYVSASWTASRWLGGGSVPGLVCGIAAGLVIVFEMLLWPRKALRRLRLVATKYWMAAHIWLGLVALPLAILHCGFHWGGWFPTTFMAIFVLTILSGIYGLAMQNLLPRWLLRNVPSETIYSQIDYVSHQTVGDAERLLVTACGRPSTGVDAATIENELPASSRDVVVVGAVRQAGRTRGRTLETRQVQGAREDAMTLWNALDEIRPFLREGGRAASPVTRQQEQRHWFARLRTACGTSSQPIVDVLEGMCDQRRQFDTQATVHRWLHFWLPIHIGLSIAVTVMLIVHVWTAFQYW